METLFCVVCDREVIRKDPSQNTCLDPSCQLERKRLRHRSYEYKKRITKRANKRSHKQGLQ